MTKITFEGYSRLQLRPFGLLFPTTYMYKYNYWSLRHILIHQLEVETLLARSKASNDLY